MTPMTADVWRKAANALIAALNAFDASRVQTLFVADAVIDDPSTGHSFEGHDGIGDYVERYFKGYHTVTRFLSIDDIGADKARLRVDFTGDFGHETGVLVIRANAEGLLERIDADLE
ncbi:nuclear transport factor 2 family protein [Rhizobium sp. S96]|uniref:nuclear transport factor 2 family protein n=1 Tax=Rhizobium sp. S96 TaxID=3055140 RepID=UPI0025AB2A69|nr:nuclear transport factor 2 family protein [Rhizobium sp. S96]MDM9621996.1 nuclear transport factor 2 family protein [Rhizobium sp. S96]